MKNLCRVEKAFPDQVFNRLCFSTVIRAKSLVFCFSCISHQVATHKRGVPNSKLMDFGLHVSGAGDSIGEGWWFLDFYLGIDALGRSNLPTPFPPEMALDCIFDCLKVEGDFCLI